MIATDIAARGIDVTRISHVINYDMPATADAYTHRIGRTGRAMKTGDAFTFITGQDAELLRSLKKMLGEKLQYQNVEGLTVSPSVCDSMGTRTAQLMRPNNGRKLFSSRAPLSRRPNQRSFKDADRMLWSPRAPQAA
jgi:superfamily II DNA/RNA helicase